LKTRRVVTIKVGQFLIAIKDTDPMIKILKITLMLTSVFLLTSCGSKSTYITFESVPNGATVYVKPIDQMEYKAIGQTPLNFRADEIEKNMREVVRFQLSIVKKVTNPRR
jgi:hypothetical protein